LSIPRFQLPIKKKAVLRYNYNRMSPKQNSNSSLFDDEYDRFVKLAMSDGILQLIEESSLEKIASMCVKHFLYVSRFSRDAEIAYVMFDIFIWFFTQHLSDPDMQKLRREIGIQLDIGKYSVDEETKKEAPNGREMTREEYLELKLHAFYHRTWNADRSMMKILRTPGYESLSAEEAQDVRKEVDAIDAEYK